MRNIKMTSVMSVIAAAALMLVIAPSLTTGAWAVKTEKPAQCTQTTGSPDLGAQCPGASGSGKNPNREQQQCTVTAGQTGTEHVVSGQQKKVCGP
jgi:hypothetical protein